MQSGYCDINWAKEHHDLWYEEVKESAEPVTGEQAVSEQSESGESTNTA